MWSRRRKVQPGTRLEEHSVIWIRSHHDPEVLRSELVPDAYVVVGLRERALDEGLAMHMPLALEALVSQDREGWSKPYAADREIDVADRNGRPLFSGLEFGPVDPVLRAEVVHYRRAWGAAGIFDYALGTDRKHKCCRPKKVTEKSDGGYRTSRWLSHGRAVDGWPGWHTHTTNCGITTERLRVKELPANARRAYRFLETPEGFWIFGQKTSPVHWTTANRPERQEDIDQMAEELEQMLEETRQMLAATTN